MKSLPRYIFAIMLAALLGCGGGTHSEFRVYPENPEVQAAAGDNGYIILGIEIPAGQYIYGNPKGPGTGRPTVIHAAGGPGIRFEKARFLPPRKYQPAGERDHVFIYEHETRVLIPFITAGNAAPGVYPVDISCEALICSQGACMPVNSTARLSIKISPDAVHHAGIPEEEIRKFSVLPAVAGEIRSREPGDRTADHSIAFKPRFLSAGDVHSILKAILYGILAGFILNFMPCVLPVVSLKIVSFVKHAHGVRRRLVAHSLLFTLGILTSFLILAFLAAFLGYQWGALFQSRWFLVLMISLVFALSLSMFGIFTINIPSFAARASHERENPYADTFMKGLLATLLATPCSGPFLGGTLAYTFTQKPPVIFLVFLSVGLGMALPYLVLALNPKFMRFVPKPGNWMVTFERIMAFLMAATAVYLIGILEAGMIMPTLWFLLAFSLGLWLYGMYGSMDRSRASRIAAFLSLVVITVGGYLAAFTFSARTGAENGHIEAIPFSMTRLIEHRDRGRVSVVNFTADWCPNCRLVEKTSLHTAHVSDALIKHNAAFYTADLTRENSEGEDLLKALGSRSIPFLAVFPPGRFLEPVCLRDIYSEKDVLRALEEAAAAAPEVDIDSIKFNAP